ncbi:hypothetical protein [Natranaerofaba carboxydovora]|uniref:hypothetical protein n=1 Tax=Natranaerofaba carboxydovora TaxID=2742683 RepID=UPI001F13B444|nr:hypothetical protein [Natranaerofaba carboxydovora]UMZ74949.1 hypothetical protein ACONDI_02555 [Natranaerofaba carboxydovora]
MNCPVDALVFEGGERPGSWPEELMLKIRLETAKSQVQLLLDIKEINSVTLITDYDELIDFVHKKEEYNKGLFLVNTKISPEGSSSGSLKSSFHYGETLKHIINEKELENVLILGGGSTPFLGKYEISNIAKKLVSAKNKESSLLYSNNPQSGDIVGFTPASSINELEPPDSDNALVMGLRYDVGLNFELMPFSAGILFDIDTPTELFFLLDNPRTGDKIKNIIANLEPYEKEMINEGMERFKKIKEVLAGYYEDVVLIGRISGVTVNNINENIKVRLRVFSEERGMKAMGRVGRKEVSSLLGYFIKDVGIDRFFSYLESLGKAAIIDSRVIFHHFDAGERTSDRFYSDLFMPDKIKNDFVREFTKRAIEAKVPVILGGHSLISGGIYCLVEELTFCTNSNLKQ